MKTKNIVPYILFGFVILLTLIIIAAMEVRSPEPTKDESKLPTLPAEELFVPIQADTLDLYLKRYFDRGELKSKKSRNQYTVEYNTNALILLHANNNTMTEARKTFETAKVEDFSISYKDKKVKIVMRKHDGYVDCPALIVAEILRKMNEQ